MVLIEDQAEVLQAQQAAAKVIYQEVQNDLTLYQDWRDSGVVQEPLESWKGISQEKVESNNHLK